MPVDPVVVATARSPIGRAFKGSLVSVRPDDLLVQVLRALLAKVPELDPLEIEDLIVGTASPWGEQGHNIARVSAILGMAGVPGTTVNRYCASSLQAIRMAAHAIRAEEAGVLVAAGVECVSRYADGPGTEAAGFENPLFAAAIPRTAARADDGADPWQPAALLDAYIAMGQTAENVRQHERVSREEMDELAYASQSRAAQAIAEGFFAREITPVGLADGTVVDIDECPRPSTTLHGLAELLPAFRPDGAVTAGNSCPLNDGAAAVVVMSDQRARELGIRPLARIVATAVTALDPEIMGLGPVEASRRALGVIGLEAVCAAGGQGVAMIVERI